MAEIIRFESVTKEFRRDGGAVRAVDDVTLAVEEGEVFGVIGHSGAGKSTLVRLVNGLERATSGRIVVNGHEITALRERELATARVGIGMVFQRFNLLRSRTVAGNVEFPLKVAGVPKDRRRRRVAELLDFVGLLDRAHDYPERLSGGQQQRVGIARALAAEPRVLLADEATSALDPQTTAEVLALLRRTSRELGVTILVITHEMDVIRSIADRVAVLDAGRVVELGSTYDVFAHPSSPVTERFLHGVVRTTPGAADLRRIDERVPGLSVIAEVRDLSAFNDVLDEVRRSGVRADVVFGGIDAIQGREFGSLTLRLHGADAAVRTGIERLSAVADVEVAS